MDKITELSNLINRLFSNEDVTKINSRDLLYVSLDEWQYINPYKAGNEIKHKIRYKIVEKDPEYCVSITEFLKDDTFYKHFHSDADEEIIVIKGCISVSNGMIKRTAFGKMSFKKDTIHEVHGEKGTLIAVRFNFK